VVRGSNIGCGRSAHFCFPCFAWSVKTRLRAGQPGLESRQGYRYFSLPLTFRQALGPPRLLYNGYGWLVPQEQSGRRVKLTIRTSAYRNSWSLNSTPSYVLFYEVFLAHIFGTVTEICAWNTKISVFYCKSQVKNIGSKSRRGGGKQFLRFVCVCSIGCQAEIPCSKEWL
jgi:hypothetical protein